MTVETLKEIIAAGEDSKNQLKLILQMPQALRLR